MKTGITTLLGLGAAMFSALGQDTKVETARTNATELAGPAFSTRIVQRLERPDEIVSGKSTFKGPLVVFFNKQNPLGVFNPFQPVTASERTERPLRDPYLGAPRGIVLFSVHR